MNVAISHLKLHTPATPMIEMDRVSRTKGLKFCHLNVRSLVNKIDQFRLHFENSNLDIITLSETWLTKDIGDNILELNKYQLFRWDRSYPNSEKGNQVKRGGGLVTYVRKDLNLTPVYQVDKCKSTMDCEVQCLELQSDVCKNILLYNVYRPPTGNVESGIEALCSVIESEVNVTKKEVLFMGDFNINYFTKQAVNTKKLIAFQNRFGLSQKVKRATRHSVRTQSLIDLIFTNMEHCESAGVIDLHISDHQPVFIVKKKSRDHRHKLTFTGRTYVRYSKVLLSDCLTNNVKVSFRNTAEPNECWELMEAFLDQFLNTHCPVKTFRTKEGTPPLGNQ